MNSSQTSSYQWEAVNVVGHPEDELAPFEAEATRWLINLLEETERSHRWKRTEFDMSLQENFGRAS